MCSSDLILDQVIITIGGNDAQAEFRSVGSVITFDGFLKVYKESFDDPLNADPSDKFDEKAAIIPPLSDRKSVV